MASILETIMMICFGLSWPINVIKAYRARTTKGTSLAFICLIIFGYIAGVSAKIVSGTFNYVLAVYIINLVFVCANLLVYFRNYRLDKKRQQSELIEQIEQNEETKNESEN